MGAMSTKRVRIEVPTQYNDDEEYWFIRGVIDNRHERDPLFRKSPTRGIHSVRPWSEREDMKIAGEAYLAGFLSFQ